MRQLAARLVLPESVLTSRWFLILATMVAFNTIVYLGLTIAKVTPWPHQVHPDRARAWLARIGVAVGPPGRHRLPESDVGHPDEPLALSIARREIPQAFGLMGGVVILYVLSGAVIVGFVDPVFDALEIAAGAAMVLVSVILSHRRSNPRAVMWAWVTTCTALVAGQVWDAYLLTNSLPIVYSLLIIVVMAPVALAWIPALTAGLAMVAIITAGGIILVSGIEDFRIAVLAVVCLVVSLMLLHLRLSVIDLVVEERRNLEAVASTDPVTAALSRRGLISLAAGMGDNAERAGSEVFVVMVRLHDLAAMNSRYGSAYADTALRTLAAVLRSCSRDGDLIGRWSGSRFVVMGMGDPPNVTVFASDVVKRIRDIGVSTGKRPVTVSVGACSAASRDTTFEQMIEAAAADLRPAS